MPEAWQIREYQRQQFLETLMRKVYQFNDRLDEIGDKPIFLELAGIVVKYLKNRQDKAKARQINSDPVGFFFEREVLAGVRNFSHTPIEEDALVAIFLKKVLNIALNPFRSELLHQEMTQPELIYNAPSRMAEIPFED